MARFIHYIDLRETDVMQFYSAESYLATSPRPTVIGMMANDGLHPNLSLLKQLRSGCGNLEEAIRLALTPEYLKPALKAFIPEDWVEVTIALADGIAIQVGLLGTAVALGAAGGFVATAWTGAAAPAGTAGGAAIGFFVGNLILNSLGLYDSAKALLAGIGSEEQRIRKALHDAWNAKVKAQVHVAASSLAFAIAVILVLVLLALIQAVLKKAGAALRKSLGPRIKELSGKWAHRKDDASHQTFLKKVTQLWDESEAQYQHDWRSRVPARMGLQEFENVATRAGMRPFHLADWSNLSRRRRWMCVLRCGKPGALRAAHMAESRIAKSVLVEFKTRSQSGLIHLKDQVEKGFLPGMTEAEADALLQKAIDKKLKENPWAKRGKFRWERDPESGELVLTEDGKFVVADYDKMGIYQMQDSGELRPHPNWTSDPGANDSPENQAFLNSEARSGLNMDQHGCSDFSRGSDGRPLYTPQPDEDFLVLMPPNGRPEIIHGSSALRAFYMRLQLPWPY